MWSTQIWRRKLDVWPVPQTIGAPGAAGPALTRRCTCRSVISVWRGPRCQGREREKTRRREKRATNFIRKTVPGPHCPQTRHDRAALVAPAARALLRDGEALPAGAAAFDQRGRRADDCELGRKLHISDAALWRWGEEEWLPARLGRYLALNLKFLENQLKNWLSMMPHFHLKWKQKCKVLVIKRKRK